MDICCRRFLDRSIIPSIHKDLNLLFTFSHPLDGSAIADPLSPVFNAIVEILTQMTAATVHKNDNGSLWDILLHLESAPTPRSSLSIIA